MLCWLVSTKHFFRCTRLFACAGEENSYHNELTFKIQLCYQVFQYQKIPISYPDSSKLVIFFFFLIQAFQSNNVISLQVSECFFLILKIIFTEKNRFQEVQIKQHENVFCVSIQPR